MYTKLFQKNYDLLRWLYPAVNHMPKSQRFVLGNRMETLGLGILEATIGLTERDSRIVRHRILVRIQQLQTLVRLSKDLSFLSFKQYEHASSILEEMRHLLQTGGGRMDKTFEQICSFRNLESAYRKARKGKRAHPEVAAFELDVELNLLELKRELESQTYRPRPLREFVIRDPKTRRIAVPDFRDRVVHHTICNVIAPHFERSFINDSYANRKNFGTHKALARFNVFKRKASQNNRLVPHALYSAMVSGFCLKADISRYFASIDHRLLMNFISKRIDDPRTIALIQTILKAARPEGKGLPLGNLTSQFFANAYLGQLDDFMKHELRARWYIRYVDDFVILHLSGSVLKQWKREIDTFLISLGLRLHPEKSKVRPLHGGISLLGFRVFPHHRLLKKTTVRTWKRRLSQDSVSQETIRGWVTHARWGNTYRLLQRIGLSSTHRTLGDGNHTEIQE